MQSKCGQLLDTLLIDPNRILMASEPPIPSVDVSTEFLATYWQGKVTTYINDGAELPIDIQPMYTSVLVGVVAVLAIVVIFGGLVLCVRRAQRNAIGSTFQSYPGEGYGERKRQLGPTSRLVNEGSV